MSNISPPNLDGDGDGKADDADMVDGQHAADLGKSQAEVQEDALIHGEGYAPGFTG